MSKQNHGSRKIRSQNRAKMIAGSPAHGARRTIVFSREPLAAPVPFLAAASSMAARVCNIILQSMQRLARPLLKRSYRRRKLQLLEMQQLGEKRFVAIVRVGKQKFLIGGAASSVSLLAEIGSLKATVLAPRPLSQETA